jgi:hypothetical protein
MSSSHDREYVDKHELIMRKLIQMAEESGSGCVSVHQIAVELGMDQRTVKGHLKIMEIHNAGVFVDPKEKEFCTKEGLILLAKKIGLSEINFE